MNSLNQRRLALLEEKHKSQVRRNLYHKIGRLEFERDMMDFEWWVILFGKVLLILIAVGLTALYGLRGLSELYP